MNNSLKWALILAVVGLTSGCLQTRETAKEQEEKQVMQKTVKTLQQTTVDSSTRFQDVDDEFRRLTGRIEILENRVAQLMQKADRNDQTVEARVKELNDKLLIYQEALTKLDAQVATLSQQVAAAQTTSKPSGASGKNDIRSHFTEAEALFEKKRWKEAILEYEKYRKGAPNGKSFGAATYKMAVCFQELGMVDEAKVFFDEVVAKYPKSGDAKKAIYRLKTLKK